MEKGETIGLYTERVLVAWLQERHGLRVNHQMLKYHQRLGRIPREAARLGGQTYYTDADVTKIMDYFNGRMYYQHTK